MWERIQPSPHTSLEHSSRLESLYTLSLYYELSAAVLGGVGELRLMTLGNQSSSELPMGGMEKRDPPRPNRDEDPYLVSEDPLQLREGLPRTYTVFFIIKNIRNHHLTDNPCWSSEDPPQLPSLSSITDVI